jgi:hypothetical protein
MKKSLLKSLQGGNVFMFCDNERVELVDGTFHYPGNHAFEFVASMPDCHVFCRVENSRLIEAHEDEGDREVLVQDAQKNQL